MKIKDQGDGRTGGIHGGYIQDVITLNAAKGDRAINGLLPGGHQRQANRNKEYVENAHG